MKNKIIFALRAVVAVILLQTLFFKFSGAPESVYIFTKLGVEPWGRWASGVFELIAAALLVRNSTAIYGAVAAAGVISGAIFSHIFVLGIVVQDDGGLLFGLALVVLLSSLGILWLERDQVILKIRRLKLNG